jgi:integrase
MRSDESLQLVRHTLNDFVAHCKRIYLKDVTRMDLLKFADWLQKVKKNGPRTANNKFMRVHQFLKTNKIELVTGKDAPKFVEERPEIYEDEEQLANFFGECSFPQLVIFKTFLMAGLRMQELMFLQWTDIGLKAATVSVTAKPERGFIPKAYHERQVSIPPELVNVLEEWQKWARPKTPAELVFPTKSGRANDKLLQACKRLARRAGLNCGHCDTCLERKECRRWFLHKFRATFATRLLQGGMDLESVREQMGHKDIESIARYLVPLKGKAMRAKVEDIWAAPKPVAVPLGQVEFKDGKITVKETLD